MRPSPRSLHARSAAVATFQEDWRDSGGVRSEPEELREGDADWREEVVDTEAARQCVDGTGGPPAEILVGLGQGPPDCEHPRTVIAVGVGAEADLIGRRDEEAIWVPGGGVREGRVEEGGSSGGGVVGNSGRDGLGGKVNSPPPPERAGTHWSAPARGVGM